MKRLADKSVETYYVSWDELFDKLGIVGKDSAPTIEDTGDGLVIRLMKHPALDSPKPVRYVEVCPNCGVVSSATLTFCPQCGTIKLPGHFQGARR